MKVTHRGELKLGILGKGIMAPQEYLEHKEALDLASELDKFDMFAGIKVIAADYEAKQHDAGDSGVGIARIPAIHGEGPVIFAHQSYAAENFLQRLRGIGILADEVGMGKTFEAGVVLSELANVVALRSLLIVARNIKDWKEVMKAFGIEPILDVASADDIRKKAPNGIPNRPMIIDMGQFQKLGNSVRGLCFDAIVVDEAHNLTDDGMKTLSVLMRTKNEQNVPYCILVSGTPHKGNLENLFPLWYFFYKRGVNFERYDEVTDMEKPEYVAAKKYYIEQSCFGAKTIAEFVEKCWERAFKDGIGEPEDVRKFQEYVKNARKTGGKDSVRALRLAFVQRPENAEMAEGIKRKISADYNDNLIGSFMIRQSRTKVPRHREKKAKNYYLCPLPSEWFAEGAKDIVGAFDTKTDSDRTDDRDRRSFRYNVHWKDLYSAGAIERLDNGRTFSLEDFTKNLYSPQILRDRDIKDKYAEIRYKKEMCDIMFQTLDKLGAEKVFSKKNSLKGFYLKNFLEDLKTDNIENRMVFVDRNADKFEVKARQFVKIVRENGLQTEKVVVFFDNDVSKNANIETETERLYGWLTGPERKKEMADIVQRIVFFGKDRFPQLSEEERKRKAAEVCSEEFSAKEAAILFLVPPLGEGFNFQYDCHTIINFSISADPVKTDQSVGRVDRIGQIDDIQIISIAYMDEMEGYLLSFYNLIKMFNEWQSDIILVSGCNSETTIKQCPQCNRIVLWMEGQADMCDRCGIKLGPLKGESYECDTCDFRLVQDGATNKVHNYAYLCSHREKLSEPFQESDAPHGAVYMCDKSCAIKHCGRLREESCEVKRLMNNGIRHKDLLTVCRICKRQGLNQDCRWCSMDMDVFGYRDGEKTPEPFHCFKCKENSCKDDIFQVEIEVDGSAECPKCKQTGRDGKLTSSAQKTFNAFVKRIWEFRAPDGSEDFVENFSGEVNKVESIIQTLKRTV